MQLSTMHTERPSAVSAEIPPGRMRWEIRPAGREWDATIVRREALIFRVEVRDLRRCAVAAVR
ncbi:hypothetical protein GCM10027091_44050 [Streptomyces daliensis]